jgi:hypothetical protein
MGSEENKAAVIEALDRFNDPENRQAYLPRLNVEEVIAEGDTVAFRPPSRAPIGASSWASRPPTSRSLSACRTSTASATARWLSAGRTPTFGLMVQLGAIPAPA